MNSRIYIDGHEVDPLDEVYRNWDGRPMTSREIAEKAGLNESTVRQLCLRAYNKIRAQATPELLEYADAGEQR